MIGYVITTFGWLIVFGQLIPTALRWIMLHGPAPDWTMFFEEAAIMGIPLLIGWFCHGVLYSRHKMRELGAKGGAA
jgi:hypothetical protein